MRVLWACVVSGVVGLVASASLAATINVPADFPTIQAAIDASMDGDTILIQPGTYNEAIDTGGKPITLTSTDPDDPSIVAMTVINANSSTFATVTFSGGKGASTALRGLTIRNGMGTGISLSNISSPTIDRCAISMCTDRGIVMSELSSPTITACEFSGNSGFVGGAIFVGVSCNPQVTNSTFTGNSAQDGGAVLIGNMGRGTFTGCTFEMNSAAGRGGTIGARAGSTATFNGCIFRDNTTAEDGGVFYGQQDRSVFLDCTFDSNNADELGGAVFTLSSGAKFFDTAFFMNVAKDGGGCANGVDAPELPELGVESLVPEYSGCTFDGNQSGDGGAMRNQNISPIVTGCEFRNNDGSFFGGAISNRGASPAISGCVFENNRTFSFDGGAIYNIASSPAISGCTFTGNMAFGGGGGIHNFNTAAPSITGCVFEGNTASNGGGLNNTTIATVSVEACVFVGNSASQLGGGVLNALGSPTLVNCLMAGNTAGINGGGVYNNTPVVMINCTLAGNTATGTGGGVLDDTFSTGSLTNSIVWGNMPNQLDGSGAPTVSFSLVQGGVPGTGNIDADPAFAGAISGDYRLTPGSPAMDAGDNGAVPTGVTTDLDGNTRIVDGTVDMGAYEVQGDAPCLGDCDDNGTVDFNDLVAMLFEFGNATPLCDADESGSVDFNDLVAALFLFGPCP